MFGNQKRASDPSSPTRTRQRRDGRGLGPFTSGHLTIIVVTVLVVVAFPFAAFAVTGSNVFVTDATSGTRAKVDSTGHVVVGDGSGSLTVDGTVNERAALPTKPIVIIPRTASTAPTTIYGPVSKPFAIGSLTLTNLCSDGTHFIEFSSSMSPGGDFVIQLTEVPALQTVHVAFPIPLVTTPPSGGTASLEAVSSGSCVNVSGVGYQT